MTIINNSIKELIESLYILETQKSPIISSILDLKLLISALTDLDNMIEIHTLKESVASQLKYLLLSNRSPNEGNNMLHTVIYGPPGVGKTKASIILAKIWTSMGLLKKSKSLINNNLTDNNLTDNNLTNNNLTDNNLTDNNLINNNLTDNNLTKYGNKIPNKEEQTNINIQEIKDMKLLMEQQINTILSSSHFKTGVIEKLQKKLQMIKENMKDLLSVIYNTKGNVRTIKRKFNKLNNEINNVNNIRRGEELFDGFNSKNISNQNIQNIFHEILSDLTELETVIKTDTADITEEELVRFSVNIIPPNNLQNNIIPPVPPPQPQINPPVIVNLTKPPEKNIDDMIVFASKEDFCAGFVGQTAIKTEILLRRSLGKVLFIDEAYSIINDERDSFGMEALTILNRFMSEHPNELIVIFAGYKELMQKTIFKAQPGLKRRCTWIFEIDNYTPKGLSEIFQQQLNKDGWKISDEISLDVFFKKNFNKFPSFGGDTLRFAFYCKICYSNTLFSSVVNNNSTDLFYKVKFITQEILDEAFKRFNNNNVEKDIINSDMYKMLYT